MNKLTCIFIMSAGLAAVALAAGDRPGEPEPTAYVPEDPLAWVLYTYTPKADVHQKGFPDAEASESELEAALALPVYTNTMFSFYTGPFFKWTHFEPSGLPMERHDTYSTALSLDALIGDRRPWELWLNVTPGLFTDFDGVDHNDYRTLLYGMATYQALTNVALALGAGYDRIFGDDQVYPLGGVQWRIGREWELDLVLPAPNITYAPTARFLGYVDLRPTGDMWNVREEGEDYDFKFESYRLGAGVEYAVADHVWLHVGAGLDFNRNYKIENDRRQALNADVDDTWFGRVGVMVR